MQRIAFTSFSQEKIPAEQLKLDAYTRMYLKERASNHYANVEVLRNSAYVKTAEVNGKETILTIVRLNDQNNIPDLQDSEAEILSQIGKLLVVRVPVDNIVKMSAADEIESVKIDRPVYLINSRSRVASGQDKVNEWTDANGNQLKGEGVVLGVVDQGIDFTHPTFKDADGNSRIKYAMVGGTSYTTPEAIAQLTCDITSGSHGSHVAGSAGGSYTDNGFRAWHQNRHWHFAPSETPCRMRELCWLAGIW